MPVLIEIVSAGGWSAVRPTRYSESPLLTEIDADVRGVSGEEKGISV